MDALSSYFSDLGASLKTPFGNAMTWTQLAAVLVFATVVLFAWRQVVNFIAEAA